MQAFSLKTILEDESIAKLMWDCRSDNSALFHLYGIRLAGVVDLQLHCLAWSLAEDPANSRTQQMFHSLHWALATANHAEMGPEERNAYSRVVQMARILSVPERGGTYDVWKQRPLPGVLRQYCTDATMFFALRAYYQQTEATHAEALKLAVQKRLNDSCDPEFGREESALRQMAEISLVSSLLAKDSR
jgi:exonuclease 3'-5' domain-containing protein 1